jgi:hypothetical protein
MCVNRFSIRMLEISNKTVQILDSYLIFLDQYSHFQCSQIFGTLWSKLGMYTPCRILLDEKVFVIQEKNWIYLSLSQQYAKELILNPEGIIVRCEKNSMEHNPYF